MGGNALLIYGTVSDERRQQPAAGSMIDRLLGRQRAPQWFQIGRDRRMIDLPPGALKSIGRPFRDYLAARLNPPWRSTAAFLEYLRLGVIDVHVRGEAAGNNPPEWYVQIGFSGCAGMAEVSAELAAHWAERWYRDEEAGLVLRYLEPYGFKPNGRTDPDRSTAVFVPMGAAGYAIYNSTPRDAGEEYFESRYFDIDASAVEALRENERAAVLRKLDRELPPILPRDSCCCQLCAPQFEVAAVDRLVPFLP